MRNDPMPEERDAEAPGDPAMGRFRERVAALIAVVIIIASLVMLALAFRSLDDKEKFARAKDLLLIINPVLGVVIGYYFNRVSTEGRAESAESVARTTAADARRAMESRDKAERVANVARADAQETRTHLEDVSQAAEKMLAQTPGRTPGTLGVSETAKPADDARSELEAALARARRIRGGARVSTPGEAT